MIGKGEHLFRLINEFNFINEQIIFLNMKLISTTFKLINYLLF